MDRQAEISSFLRTRRARLSPQQAGIAYPSSTRRRVPGLRREEVAELAGVSPDYYARLERGRISHASPEVLESIASALRLDDDERQHLFNLADSAPRPTQTRSNLAEKNLRADLRRVLDSINTPAFIQNHRLDRIGANRLGRLLYSLPADGSGDTFNYARFLFLDQRAATFHRDLDQARHATVSSLHAASAKAKNDRELIGLIDELNARSEEFRNLWELHDVGLCRIGSKLLTHTLVGELDFGYETFTLTDDDGLTLIIYTMQPGSPTEERMRILSSWELTHSASHNHHTSAAAASDQSLRELNGELNGALPQKCGLPLGTGTAGETVSPMHISPTESDMTMLPLPCSCEDAL
ncbi:MAG: helix-turn-helix domain-containing protein [Actinomycetaceae bacterium]|nr:helix-turn-helix domain-containing protein [Actinomycetaceae bacterium]